MKENISRIGRLYFLIILGACLSFNGCTSDDNDDVIKLTWLEKYDGTKWVDGDDFLFIRIIDNTNIIFETWFSDGPCFVYNVSGGNVDFKIIENGTDKLIFEIIEDGEIQKLTLMVNGDILTILLEYNDKSETLTFRKTNEDVDNFLLCES